jgi:hypothetical protein
MNNPYGNNGFNRLNPSQQQRTANPSPNLGHQQQPGYQQPGYQQPAGYQQPGYNPRFQQPMDPRFMQQQMYQQPMDPRFMQQPMYQQPMDPRFQQQMYQQPMYNRPNNFYSSAAPMQNTSYGQPLNPNPGYGAPVTPNTGRVFSGTVTNSPKPNTNVNTNLNSNANISNQQPVKEETGCKNVAAADGHEFSPYYDPDTEKLKQIVDNDCNYTWKIDKK